MNEHDEEFIDSLLDEYYHDKYVENVLNKSVEFTIRGTIDWCKLIGPARPYTGDPRYDKGPSWSVEINPDEKSRAVLKKHGLEEKFKKDKPTKKDGTPTKNPRSYDFIRLTILQNKADGSKNNPPEIKDVSGRLWDDTELGNGTVVDILVKYVDYGTTKGLYFRKMRVLKLIPYEGGSDFEPLSEDDEFFGALVDTPQAGAQEPANMHGQDGEVPDDLDDDVPF